MSNKPVYMQLIDRLSPAIRRLGLTVEERESWVVIKGPNGHRVAVQRSAASLPRIETTVGPEHLGGAAAVVTDNGRIRARVEPSVLRREGIAFVEAMLELLADPEYPVAPPRRGGADRQVPDLDSLLAQAERELCA